MWLITFYNQKNNNKYDKAVTVVVTYALEQGFLSLAFWTFLFAKGCLCSVKMFNRAACCCSEVASSSTQPSKS